jgi:hypothetical protein
VCVYVCVYCVLCIYTYFGEGLVVCHLDGILKELVEHHVLLYDYLYMTIRERRCHECQS